jgi:hypothetical protein
MSKIARKEVKNEDGAQPEAPISASFPKKVYALWPAPNEMT